MLYFAYGPDMSKEYLAKNNVQVIGSTPARLQDHFLSFDQIGIPYWEPSFATLTQKPVFQNHTVAHGVVHQIKQQDFDNYCKISKIYNNLEIKPVMVQTYDGQTIQVNTLVNNDGLKRFGRYYPSQQYMKAIIKGARQNHLKEGYVEFLSQIPTYHPQQTGFEYVFRLLFLIWFQILTFPIWSIQHCAAYFNLKFPSSLSKINGYALMFASFQHEFLWKHFAGDGSGRLKLQ